ncbi:hypothetical protein GP486_006515 [Trichoglossum hirsutum]|uniref:Uncharacterized protein n=1 Tax=Trichoglossum hirsutum TaxID=265104 RepID=A0A9P8L3M1_9PEZI|nr:hypothetical protein GP486_006515 [Trichoglossum hirsutum]
MNPTDSTAYLFDNGTSCMAYSLPPNNNNNMPPILYPPDISSPYPGISADWAAASHGQSHVRYVSSGNGKKTNRLPGATVELPGATVEPSFMSLEVVAQKPLLRAHEPFLPGHKRKLSGPPEMHGNHVTEEEEEEEEANSGEAPSQVPAHRRTTPSNAIRPSSMKAVSSRARRANFNGSQVYPPLPDAPEQWSVFQYTRTGELVPRFYTVDQISDFLYHHPLHVNQFGIEDSRNSGLEIFIQRTPADSSRRYPTSTSSLCRFEKCFIDGKTIQVGHFRVCFREDRTPFHRDPYHNAGYVHLFCLEYYLNFPDIVRRLNVKADTRRFVHEPQKKGPGPMELVRCVERAAVSFIAECRDFTLSGYPSLFEINRGVHEGTLTYRLHMAKIEDECPVRAKVREQRGSKFTHNSHLGNLRLFRTRTETLRAQRLLRQGRGIQQGKPGKMMEERLG